MTTNLELFLFNRNIVDVSQMDNTISEQHDYQDRAKRYTDKIQNNPMVKKYAK